MLHELVTHALQEQLVVEPGFKPKLVRWLMLFSSTGAFLGIQDLSDGSRGSKGRQFAACPDLTQQEMVSAGAGCRHFLVDGVDVVCLLTKDGQIDDKLLAKHEYFVSLLEEASAEVYVLRPIAASLRDETVLESARRALAEHKAKPTELVTLAIGDVTGAAIVVEQEDWREWWRAKRESMATQRKAKSTKPSRERNAAPVQGSIQMRCLLSGALVEPQPTHNKIEGLSDVGGLSMGDALTSFDKEAFASFGLEQGANAAMSEAMVKTYVTSLNHLIRNNSRRLAGVKVIYWYSGKVANEDDPMRELFEGFGLRLPDGDEEQTEPSGDGNDRLDRHQAQSCARRLLDAFNSGKSDDLNKYGELKKYRYYALTLSANSGRVVVRDWMEGPFESLVLAVNAWFEDLAIVARNGKGIVADHKFAAVLAAPLRDLKDATAPLTATLWHCALKILPIPRPIMAQTLYRVRNDILRGDTPLHARLGLLKAFCNRNEGTPNMTAELNEFESEPAYLCGRMMAILASIQQRALGDIGAGVVQRYYAAASATPALVLGRLIRTAQTGHLPKIREKGLQFWFENQLADVWCKLNQRPPAVLDLEGQTLFAMGYYQQVAKQRAGSNDKTAQEDQEREAAASA